MNPQTHHEVIDNVVVIYDRAGGEGGSVLAIESVLDEVVRTLGPGAPTIYRDNTRTFDGVDYRIGSNGHVHLVDFYPIGATVLEPALEAAKRHRAPAA